MLRVSSIALLLSLASVNVFAMNEDSSHYNSASPQSQIADPDEKDDFQSGPPTGAYAQSGREQALLGGGNTGQQTYGFGSPNGSLSYGFGQSTTLGSGYRH